jgi:hypothetical protein
VFLVSNSITRIFPSLGEIGTTAEIVELLDKTLFWNDFVVLRIAKCRQ